MARLSNELKFTKKVGNDISAIKYGEEWPIVYIIYDEEEAYVGETVDAKMRMEQHYENPRRRKLKNVRVITDEQFNKSAVLDLEAFLISHMSADTKFKNLQNGNAGHQRHNYYQKEMYTSKFAGIWRSLQRYGLAKKEIKKIEDENLFKFSPYKTLTKDQYLATCHIIHNLVNSIENEKQSTYIVNGGPGTGKTVLAIYLMKLLTTDVDEDIDSEDEKLIEDLAKLRQILPHPKIGIVVSMSNLRKTLQDVFKSTHGLSAKMVNSPSSVTNRIDKFDILIVDEAHRLKAPRNMMGTELNNMRSNNAKLGLNEDTGTQLDWILKKSKHQIFFYDEFQSIKRTDIEKQRFESLKKYAHTFDLDTQIRCGKGGKEYVKYIRSIFSDEPPEKYIEFKDKTKNLNYDFRIFDDVKQMTDNIIEKNKKYNLCRNIAGYAWKWKTKNKIHPQNAEQTKQCIKKGKYDIEINGHKYIWNSKYYSWVSTPNSENEIGCIHTIQGFDLNYAGVIIGNDLKYDKENHRLFIDKKEYFDINGKNKTSDEDLRNYILNIYAVLCTRGIDGTYIYACDKNLKEYLKKYIKAF